ncbi:MAG TPA: hypothetical protein VGX21_20980 [Methylomirabilota bacterium]|jgi:hypothetical protein|nr:hypothetical protein [Methylomirabilota bacterium]
MRTKVLAVLGLAALVAAGCAADQLKSQKDNAWSHVGNAVPDTQPANAGGYGHPFRALAFVFHPVGVALDWALVKPFYLLAGVAPEWFGLRAEDAQRYQSHYPELINSPSAPKRLE